MKSKVIKILLVICFILFISSLIYIVYNQYEMKKEEKMLEELQQSIIENPANVDIVEEPQQTITTATEYVPKTGETGAIPFAYGIMGMSATGLAAILVKRKKSR